VTDFPRFDLARLQRRLPASQLLGRQVAVYAQTPSTQVVLRGELGALGPSARGLLVLAEHQIAGRGRTATDWWSGPARANLAISLAVHEPPVPPESLGMHAACALAEAARPHAAGRRLALKWPNDLLLDGAKFAGLLVDAGSGREPALLGVGVNLRAAPPAEVAPYPTTCLDPAARREDFLARWLLALERRLVEARARGPARLDRDCLRLLQAWAPHGVREPRTAHAGPMVRFSVQNGLSWGVEGDLEQRPLGWIDRLEPLPAPPRPPAS
jgi:BirA family biotin operon repressor/biotin-[acetyl-CoA-carboxylase] ligase